MVFACAASYALRQIDSWNRESTGRRLLKRDGMDGTVPFARMARIVSPCGDAALRIPARDPLRARTRMPGVANPGYGPGRTGLGACIAAGSAPAFAEIHCRTGKTAAAGGCAQNAGRAGSQTPKATDALSEERPPVAAMSRAWGRIPFRGRIVRHAKPHVVQTAFVRICGKNALQKSSQSQRHEIAPFPHVPTHLKHTTHLEQSMRLSLPAGMHPASHRPTQTLQLTHLLRSILGRKSAKRERRPRIVPTGQT